MFNFLFFRITLHSHFRTLCINLYVFLTGYIIKMSRTVLDLEEWELVLAKMHRHHANVAQEVAIIVQTIRKEMKSELVPLAEEKATYGKVHSHAHF